MDDLTFCELVRGTILKSLRYDANRRLSDVALKASVWSLDYKITKDQVRHQMVYLEDKNLIEIHRQNSNLWIARLTARGVDVLEGRGDPVIGIIIND